MSTPTLKLLLNALRLGQPQDPQAAIFALAEHILAQDDLIEDLRKRITVVQSAAQILETKAVRLENELESFLRGGYASAPRHQAQFQAQQQQQAQQQAAQQQAQLQTHQPQNAHGPFSVQQLVPHGQAQHGPQPAAYQPPQSQPASQRPPPMPAGGPQSGPKSTPPPSHAAPSVRSPSVAPPPASEPPPPFRSPNSERPPFSRQEVADPVRTRMVRSTPQMSRTGRTGRAAREPMISEESSGEDFGVQTVVVHKKDLEKLKRPEAPFRLPPPGASIGPDRGSIPGAPWAKGNRVDVKVRPAIADEFTIDAVQHEQHDEIDDENSDDEGVTYRDAGGLPSLAQALGLAPGDPRLEALRRGRDAEDNEEGLPPASRSRKPT